MSPVSALGLSGRGLLLADGDLVTLRTDDLLPVAANAVVVIPLGLIGALTPLEAVVAMLAGNFLAVSFAFVKAGVRPGRPAPAGPMLSYGARSMVASLAIFGNQTFDQALVAPLLGVRQLGYYSIAVAVSTAPLGLALALATRAYGDVGRAGDAPDERVHHAERALRLTLLVTGLLVAAIVVIAPVAIPVVYSHPFRQAVIPALILLPGSIGLGLFITASNCALAIGVPEYGTYSALAGLVVTAGGLPVAIPTLGINGAAIVSAVAYAVMGGTLARLLRRQGVRHIVPRVADAAQVWAAGRGILGRLVRRGR
jgi:O-antigen/teichoic acid export membrane protein